MPGAHLFFTMRKITICFLFGAGFPGVFMCACNRSMIYCHIEEDKVMFGGCLTTHESAP